MKKFRSILLPLFLLLISGCAWQRIPAAPEYTKEQPIPLRVGVIASESPVSQVYVAGLVKELKSMQLFDSITYPYRDGDSVDVVTTISVDGQWKGSGAGAGIVIGLTFGIASPFIGPSLTGTHDIKARMVCGKEDVGLYTAQASSTVTWGLMGNSNEASKKADDLQLKRMADALAKQIRSDRQNLLAKVNSSH